MCGKKINNLNNNVMKIKKISKKKWFNNTIKVVYLLLGILFIFFPGTISESTIRLIGIYFLLEMILFFFED